MLLKGGAPTVLSSSPFSMLGTISLGISFLGKVLDAECIVKKVWPHFAFTKSAIKTPIRSHSESHAVRISKLIVPLYILEVHKKIF